MNIQFSKRLDLEELRDLWRNSTRTKWGTCDVIRYDNTICTCSHIMDDNNIIGEAISLNYKVIIDENLKVVFQVNDNTDDMDDATGHAPPPIEAQWNKRLIAVTHNHLEELICLAEIGAEAINLCNVRDYLFEQDNNTRISRLIDNYNELVAAKLKILEDQK